ncbi:MAG: urea ABC transporter ATP-binding subunit UrtE [Gammaproteobacteria bacterium]|nr:urea ABC transporter ATP-binding subunit UrtE [Gammaproteobacteria bacterium]
MLSIVDLNQYYGESHTLWDLTLEVPEGSCTCLMGRNGVGKSTLLKCAMGLLPIRSGTLRFDDVELTRLAAHERATLGIGYVPQGREIFPLLTVEENLRVGLGVKTRRARRSRTDRSNNRGIPALVFEIFPVLEDMLHRRGGDLSGGQQQQLAIGRALVLEPRLLILDEPTEGIQPNIVAEIGDIILRLNHDQGLTVLLVEQKLPFARRVADRFCLMERGRLVAGGAIGELHEELVRRHLTV